MLGKLANDQIDNLLYSEVVGRIGCSTGDINYVVPITYVFKNDCIYCHSKEGQKVEIMRKNPSVCFEVDRIINMSNWISVIVHGRFEELEGHEADTALGYMANRLMPISMGETSPPKYGMQYAHHELVSSVKPITFKIEVQKKSGRFEKN